MATFHPHSTNQRDLIPAIYQRILGHEPCSDLSIPPSNLFQYYGSSGSYSDPTADNSRLRMNLDELPVTASLLGENNWVEKKCDMVQFDSFSLFPIAQGLSLSLGREHPLHSIQYHSTTDEASFSGSHLSLLRSSSCSRDSGISYEPSLFYPASNSKYLKAAQELLEEVVNVQITLDKNPEKSHSNPSQKESNSSTKNGKMHPDTTDGFDPSAVSEIPAAERQVKLAKLLNMLDEVDRMYKQYCHQIEMVVLTFDQVAGLGAGKQYTALARQTISHQFRALRDAIDGQIRAISMGQGELEQPSNGDQSNGGIHRLRFIDQKIRQERSFQQFGMSSQNAWWPQRGLPETSVSILRAWLFEHFLHPYPKDSDKLLLARQTGLTRNQVSNWFINARVRLWKPMVEEMYKEEFHERDDGGDEPSRANPPTNEAKAFRQEYIRSEGGGGVSLTLGLDHTQNISREGWRSAAEMPSGNASYIGPLEADCEAHYLLERQRGTGSSQLHDFVV